MLRQLIGLANTRSVSRCWKLEYGRREHENIYIFFSSKIIKSINNEENLQSLGMWSNNC